MILVLLASALMVLSFGAEARTLAANGDKGTAFVCGLISVGFGIVGLAACF